MSAVAELSIDAAAIAANTRTIAQRAPNTALMAVVKADAFGHGLAALAALRSGASWLGGTSIDEMLPYRRLAPERPMLSWLNPVDADFSAAIAARIDLAVPGIEHLHAVAAATRAVPGRPARVHLHLDVGMARDGAPVAEWRRLCDLAREYEHLGGIRVVGVMGHLSSADRPEHPQTRRETLVFANAVRVARRRGLAIRHRHLAATAAALTDPGTHFDLVRVGAGLYGIDPSRTTTLTGAMTLRAPIVSIRDAVPGTGVGYGHTYSTRDRTRLALLPLGYADGVPRQASNRAEVQLNGRRAPVVGTISMDQTVVDIGDAPASLGDDVIVFGPGDHGEPTMSDWARWAGSVEHDIVTGIGARVPRRFIEVTGVEATGTGP